MGQKSKGTGIRSRGGVRVGAGRKRGEGSTTVRVPIGLLHEVRELISVYKASSVALKAVGCNEGVSLGQVEAPLVTFPNQSVEAELPVPGSEHRAACTELARGAGRGGSDGANPCNTGNTSTARPDDALSALEPFSSWQKRLATLQNAPSKLRGKAIYDFGSLERAAKENLAYDQKSNGLIVFDPGYYALLSLANSSGRI